MNTNETTLGYTESNIDYAEATLMNTSYRLADSSARNPYVPQIYGYLGKLWMIVKFPALCHSRAQAELIAVNYLLANREHLVSKMKTERTRRGL